MVSGCGRWQIVTMHAFIDESGTNPETPVLSVAGCYGTKDQWEAFRKIWEPHSSEFHAKNSSRLFPQLCDAIESCGINGMLLTVSKRTYKESANAHLKTAIGNAYSVCALLCALMIGDAVYGQPVSFVLEQGQPNLGFVKNILEAMMDAGEPYIAAIVSARKDEFIELHTADFVSHLSSTNDRPWMQRLFNAKRMKHAHITKDKLDSASIEVTKLFRKVKKMRNAENSR